MVKFAYKFSNLCGAVYRQGNVVFTDGGDSLLSAVGNRVSHFDLKNQKTWTYPFENRKNIYRFAVSPDGLTAVTVDEDGRALLVNLYRKIVLHHFNFKGRVYDIKYSPNGKFIAVTHEKRVYVWHAPGRHRDFHPFRLYRRFSSQYDETRCIDWTDDSSFFAVGSSDMSCRIFSLLPLEGFHYVTLAAHRGAIVACFFENQSLNLYSVSRDGALVVWEASMSLAEMQQYQDAVGGHGESDVSKGKSQERVVTLPEDDDNSDVDEDEAEEEEETSGTETEEEDHSPPGSKRKREMNVVCWKKSAKHLFGQDRSHVTCAAMHKQSHLLVVGFGSGIFGLYELPECINIHTLSISEHRISSVAICPSGELLAFGCRRLGQLLVWGWQSETYVLKQQSHLYDMNAMNYSPDGQFIATGGDDGKVKVWDTSSGFCSVTFSEHSAAVTSVLFNSVGKAIFSASLDGTIRAFDLHRNRNFRTFASPRPVQFVSLALDPSGEVICAGSHDTFEIFVWSVQTGRLLEVLAGHEGPVSCVSFSPSRALLASCSWDKTVRLWDVFEKKGNFETFHMTTLALSLSFRPDGEELAVATLDGHISFWNVSRAVQVGSIEGRRDLQLGRKVDDKVTAKHLEAAGAHFLSLCYTADGLSLLAGGRSKFVCLYNVTHQILLKKFQISRNQSLDGMKQFLNSAHMTEAGPLEALSGEESDGEKELRAIKLPGVRKGEMSERRTRPEIRTKCLQFSPTGQAWGAVTTEGLLIFTLDSGIVFDPFDLSIDITPQAIRQAVCKGELASALVMSLRLNERSLVVDVMEATPLQDVEVILQGLELTYIERLLPVISERLNCSPHLHFYIHWCSKLLSLQVGKMKAKSKDLLTSLTDLQKSVVQKQSDLGKLCDSNTYALEYIISVSHLQLSGSMVADMEVVESAA